MKFQNDNEQATQPNEKESLWEKVLAEHREHSTVNKARDVYPMFVVGDKNDEKMKVLKWLKQQHGDDDETEGEISAHGLSFGYGEWKASPIGDDEELTVRILHTVIEQPPAKFLLPSYFLSTMGEKTIQSSVFAITVDLSIPHLVLKRLNDWFISLDETVKEIHGDNLELRQTLQQNMKDQCEAFHTDPATLAKKKAEADDCLEVISPTDMGRSSQTYKKMGIYQKGNLGVPLIVICTKAKLLEQIAHRQAKDPKDRGHLLNYVQGALRKWCVERGAALFYTNGDKETVDVVKEYLLFRLANIPMRGMTDERKGLARRVPAAIFDNTKLFIPAFADSLPQVAKIQTGAYADKRWEQVFEAPTEEAAGEPELPKMFPEWVSDMKSNLSSSDLLGPGTTRLEKIRNRTPASAAVPGAGGAKMPSLEATAESFFSNMIKTYRPRGAAKDKKPSRSSKPAAT